MPADPSAPRSTEAQEARFVEMVEASWARHHEFEYASALDEILLGAVVTAEVQDGWMLIDLHSDGTRHALRFEEPDSRRRFIFALDHQAEGILSLGTLGHAAGASLTANALGHLAEITLGVGARVDNANDLWSSFAAEMKSSFLDATEPGVVTLNADLVGSFIYAEVRLLWDLNDYMRAPWEPDLERLTGDLAAARASLGKYLRGRLEDLPATAEPAAAETAADPAKEG